MGRPKKSTQLQKQTAVTAIQKIGYDMNNIKTTNPKMLADMEDFAKAQLLIEQLDFKIAEAKARISKLLEYRHKISAAKAEYYTRIMFGLEIGLAAVDDAEVADHYVNILDEAEDQMEGLL